MSRALLLEGEARDAALAELAVRGWQLVEGRDAIEKGLKFKTFSEAWGFMSRVALKAEALDHHPEWRNVYNRVDVVLTTHSCAGLSELDLKLARAIDAYAGAAEVVKGDEACGCGGSA